MSNIPVFIDALVATAQTIPNVAVHDGVTVNYPELVDGLDILVTVGFSPSQEEKAVSSETAYQSGAPDGRQLFDVLVGITVSSGEANYKALRDLAYEVLAEFRTRLKLPLLAQVMSNRIHFEDLTYPESVDGTGFIAQLDFTVQVDSWIYAT